LTGDKATTTAAAAATVTTTAAPDDGNSLRLLRTASGVCKWHL